MEEEEVPVGPTVRATYPLMIQVHHRVLKEKLSDRDQGQGVPTGSQFIVSPTLVVSALLDYAVKETAVDAHT